MSATPLFEPCFHALTGYNPMPWQARLFRQMVRGDLPQACDLPTGLGKTSVIPIWLIALIAQDGGPGVRPLPRRLVYIVNRRTVVDQATQVVETIRERLLNPQDGRWITHKEMLEGLCRKLQALSANSNETNLLGISTLRGELADNEEWKADPARPAIIIGTIDMVGSKLLFSGYGDGPYQRAHHAGLIGQDALIVHDEAHLTPAFSDLLHHVADAQREANELRPLRVMELSATQRNHDSYNDIFRLEPEDEDNKIVRDRLDAKKHLRLHEADKSDAINKLVEIGKQHGERPSKVLIYVRSPEDAQQVAKKLNMALGRGADDRIALLTGTIRSHERDLLVKDNPVYRALLDHESPVNRTVYLVSTSAGEVGIDLDADHMICDLTALDSMIQRLGRVNRRGGDGREARVDVVGKPPASDNQSEVERASAATHALLKKWVEKAVDDLNVSPGNLRSLLGGLKPEETEAAFSPKPDTPPLTDILLDAWSLTSIDTLPGRPEVAQYLHGVAHDPPETYVVWRKEVALLDEASMSGEALINWFRACRIEAREWLRDRTDRVKKALGALLQNHRKHKENERYDFNVVLLNERGNAEMSKLSQIVEKDFTLEYRTVVLPVEAGGLDTHGMLDAKILEPISDIDVAEMTEGRRRERWRHIRTEDGEHYERVLTGDTTEYLPNDLREQERISLKQPQEGAENNGESADLVLLVSPLQSAQAKPETAKVKQSLAAHSGQIADYAKSIAEAVGLNESLSDALITAARWHDRGKDRPIWQRYACNSNVSEPLAKSTKFLHGRALGGYRHEFGSLLEASADDGLRTHPERDLILHLIAAHHDYARPHFGPRAFDHERFSTQDNEEAAAAVMRRFGQLQQCFGRWGLAWLESLLRCADIAASKAAAGKGVSVSEKREITA